MVKKKYGQASTLSRWISGSCVMDVLSAIKRESTLLNPHLDVPKKLWKWSTVACEVPWRLWLIIASSISSHLLTTVALFRDVLVVKQVQGSDQVCKVCCAGWNPIRSTHQDCTQWQWWRAHFRGDGQVLQGSQRWAKIYTSVHTSAQWSGRTNEPYAGGMCSLYAKARRIV